MAPQAPTLPGSGTTQREGAGGGDRGLREGDKGEEGRGGEEERLLRELFGGALRTVALGKDSFS